MSFESWTPTGSSLITGIEETGRVVWPYCPLQETIEALEWLTDVITSKAQEQRIALRTYPRRVFNYNFLLTDYQLTGARALVRRAQAAGGFLVPDWAMAKRVGVVLSGSAETLLVDLEDYHYGTKALLWESPDKYDQVNIDRDSSNMVTVDPITNDYENALLIPLWNASLVGGMAVDRRGKNYNDISVEFTVVEGEDIAASDYPVYRNLNVMTDCPKLSGGLSESISWAATTIDNVQSELARLRTRDYPEYEFDMRWHVFTPRDVWDLRRWLYSRRGRQKAFWISSFSKDFEPANSVIGTYVFVYAPPGSTTTGHLQGFDIEIVTRDGTSYYRRVNAVYDGPVANDRNTWVLDIDTVIDSNDGLPIGDIARISYLRCARFNADRMEFLHRASGGSRLRVPCVEVAEPT